MPVVEEKLAKSLTTEIKRVTLLLQKKENK